MSRGSTLSHMVEKVRTHQPINDKINRQTKQQIETRKRRKKNKVARKSRARNRGA